MASITNPQAILAAGVYGTALLFFVYGFYAHNKAKTSMQGKNVRWYLGIGAVVVIALIGLEAVKELRNKELPDVHLTFSPRFSDIGLPNPVVEYGGTPFTLGAPIRVSDNSTINISVDKVIESVKGLQKSNTEIKTQNEQLRSAYGSAVLSGQPKDFVDKVAAVGEGATACAQGDQALCGWAQLSEGKLSTAQQSFEKVIATSGSSTAERATALQGLGEIHAGQGRMVEAKAAFTKASQLGNEGAEKRLKALALPQR